MAPCPLRLLAMGLLAVAFCAGSVEEENPGSRRSQGKKSQWNNSPTGENGERRTGSFPLSSSNDLETTTGKIRSLSPWDTWMLFSKQSDKGVNSRRRCKPKKFKLGIPGPRGPAGPPGPPGAIITQEELLREFRLLLKGIIGKPERINFKACDNCQEEEEEVGDSEEDNFLAQIAGPLLESKEQGQVAAAFHCRTRKNISIERRSLQELKLYYIPKKWEMFHRGIGLNLTSGQYIASVSGYYIFTATLHIVPGDLQKKNPTRTRDRLRLLICIDSLCHQNISLETVSSWDGNSEHFTTSINGILFLLAGQYASVFVDNGTGSSLVIRSGSNFSAILLGI